MVERVRIGTLPDNSKGMMVARPGKDISSTSVDDFLVHPSAYMGRVYASAQCLVAMPHGPTIKQSSAGGNNIPAGQYRYLQDYTVLLYHGFGYVPVFTSFGANFQDISHVFADTSYIYGKVYPAAPGSLGMTFGAYYYSANDQPVGTGYTSTYWNWDASVGGLRSSHPDPTRLLVFREPLSS